MYQKMCSLLTHSYYYIGIRANLISIKYVPEENKTYNLCLAAIYHNGHALLVVPEHLKTAEMCMMAVKNTGYALAYVPESIKTYEMCLIAVQQYALALEFVPHLMKTPELCKIAFEKNAIAFLAVPVHMKTYQMCLIAVQYYELALLSVPEEFQTDTLISIALLHYPAAKRFIKKNISVPVIHGSPKQMPEKAYDLLELGYDDQSAIKHGEIMVDFHDEFKFGRFYRKKTFEDMVLPSKKNPTTREAITQYTIYQAKI